MKRTLFALLLCATLHNGLQASKAAATVGDRSDANAALALLKGMAAMLNADQDPNTNYRKNVIDMYGMVRQQYPMLSLATVDLMWCEVQHSTKQRDAVRDAVRLLILGEKIPNNHLECPIIRNIAQS